MSLAAPNADAVWARVSRAAMPRRASQIQALREFLETSYNPHAMLLTGRTPGAPVDDASVRQIEHLVIAQLAGGKLTRMAAVDWIGLVYAALKIIDSQGEPICMTRLAVAFPPQTSPFAPGRAEAATRAGRWQDKLFEWIRFDADAASPAAWHAAIVLSAVLNGALLDTTKIRGLLDRLARGEHPEVGKVRRTCSFDLPFNGMGNVHLQRWEVDPITEMLFYRSSHAESALGERELLNSFGSVVEQPPKSLKELVEAAEPFWASKAAQVDLQASRRRIQSHAIAPRPWLRISGAAITVPGIRLEDAEPSAATIDGANAIDELQTLYPWMTRLLAALGMERTEDAREAIDALANEHTSDSAATTYLDWAVNCLDGASASGKPVSLVTARRRILAALPRLLALLGDNDPSKLDTPELEDGYWEIVVSAERSPDMRDLVGGLRDFHSYLVKNHGKAQILDDKDIFGGDDGLRPVDANLLSFDEYAGSMAVLDRMVSERVPPALIRSARIAMMLAFRVGLRRMEVFGLRRDDIKVAPDLVAVIRPHGERGLKTNNARRLLPLFVFLPQKERIELQAQVDAAAGQRYLFPEFSKASRLSWIDRVCDLVVRALRQVTRDKTLTLHHLRHAFGSWTYLRLRAAALPEVISHFDHLPETRRALQTGKRLGVLLTGRGNQPTRSLAHQVGMLLGHSSAFVSLTHYVHVSDIILGAIVRRQVAAIPHPVLVSASGLSTSPAYAALEEGLDRLLLRSRIKYLGKMPKAGDGQRQPRGRPRDQRKIKNPDWIELENVGKVIFLSVERSMSTENIAALLGLQIERVASILARAKKYGAFVALTDFDGNLAHAPSKLRGEMEHEIFANIEVRLSELAIRAPQLYRQGLEIHLVNLNRTKWDTIFRGPKYLKELRVYLRFLKALGMSDEQFVWVVRKVAAQTAMNPSAMVPSWCEHVRNLNWWPRETRRIGPPRTDRQSYSEWVGLRPQDSITGHAYGKLFSMAAFLALTQIPCENHR
jgi:integrase